MRISVFLKLAEIQTKVASVIPFFLGALFAYYRYGQLNPLLLIVFFVSMISVDMATTVLNNYMDFKRARVKSGYNYEEHNAIVAHGLRERQVVAAVIVLLTIGGVFGMTLFALTDIVILFIGLAASFVGVIYSFGPIPLSRTPLGEIFSGIIMGGLIFFVSVYLNVYDQGYVIVYISHWVLGIELNIVELFIIIYCAVPMILMIAGIMLANNICDMEEDLQNGRYTLPHFIGKKFAKRLFYLLYALVYVFIAFGVIFRWLPVTCLVVFATIPPVVAGLKAFEEVQTKEKTFVVSVKNFILISAAYGLGILMSIIAGFLMHY